MANHDKDISVSERQIYILSLLSQNPIGYTADEIVSRLDSMEVTLTKRTIQRDIDDLSVNYAIEEVERNGNTYYMARKFNLKNVDLTIRDMMGISFMQHLIEPYLDTTLGCSAKEILDKITSNTGNLNQKHLMELSKSIYIGGQEKTPHVDINQEVWDGIVATMDKHVKIRIHYMNWNTKEITERIIQPYRMVILDAQVCVEGFCELRQEIRTFRLSRIKKLEILKDTFELPEEYMEEASRNTFIYMSGKESEMLRIQFDQETGKFVKEYHKQRADRLVQNEDGYLFEKQTAITSEVKKWILQFGAGAKVLEPQHLVDDLQAEVKAMINKYE